MGFTHIINERCTLPFFKKRPQKHICLSRTLPRMSARIHSFEKYVCRSQQQSEISVFAQASVLPNSHFISFRLLGNSQTPTDWQMVDKNALQEPIFISIQVSVSSCVYLHTFAQGTEGTPGPFALNRSLYLMRGS